MYYYFYNLTKLKQYMAENKKIFLYPQGYYTTEILKNLKYIKMDIYGVIDKNPRKIQGIETMSVDKVVAHHNESVVFITSIKYEEELRKELINNGYTGIIENFFEKNNMIKKTTDSIFMERMDLVLTTKCSLRCEKCANLMQYYKHPTNVSLDIIIKSMKNLLNAVDEIQTVYVLGGEPFLYNQLNDVIVFLKKQEKIKNIVIITNGTLCPQYKENVWKEICGKNVTIRISDYGKISGKKEEILNICYKYGINCEIEENKIFYDTGNMKKRNRTIEQLQKVFINCNTQCRSLYNGELHFCPRSSHGVDLGIVDRREQDYVNLIEIQDMNLLKKQIRHFLNRDSYVEACDFCDIRLPGYYEHEFPAAEQAAKVLKA